jgi:hypothetical protein
MHPDACGLASQPRHQPAVNEIITCRHFGNDEPGPEARRHAPKGGIRDTGHRCQENPVSDLNIAYFQ